MSLTLDDLQAIGKLLAPIQEEQQRQGADISAIKAEQAKQGKDITTLKKDVKGLKRDMRKVRKDQKIMLNLLDVEPMRQRKKIERLEKHNDLEPLEFVPGTAKLV